MHRRARRSAQPLDRMEGWPLKIGKALAIVLPLLVPIVAFGFLWTQPGDAQWGPTIVTLIPIVILGLPWNLFGCMTSSVASSAFPGGFSDAVGASSSCVALAAG